MGWTVGYREPGLTTREFFEREMPNTLAGKIVASATAPQEYDSGSVFYAAVREPEGERCNPVCEPGDVWAFVALTGRWGGGYGYKEMSEEMGPSVRSCPPRVLKHLTPTEHEWANEWRRDCWAHAKIHSTKPTVNRGDRVRFSKPLEFESGDKHQELTLENARRHLFRSPAGQLYRLPRSWKREYAYEVIGQAD